MKITIDIDCTPEEARTFFGLPDVKPLQEAMVSEVLEHVRSGMKTMDMDALIKTWLPTGIQGMEQFQKMFWSSFSQSDSKKSEGGS